MLGLEGVEAAESPDERDLDQIVGVEHAARARGQPSVSEASQGRKVARHDGFSGRRVTRAHPVEQVLSGIETWIWRRRVSAAFGRGPIVRLRLGHARTGNPSALVPQLSIQHTRTRRWHLPPVADAVNVACRLELTLPDSRASSRPG